MIIKIGGGFSRQKENQKKFYPLDRLQNFINVDPNDQEAISKFCDEYQFLPRNLVGGVSVGFVEEQTKIKLVVDHIQHSKVTQKDIDLINAEIDKVKIRAHLISTDEATSFNKQHADRAPDYDDIRLHVSNNPHLRTIGRSFVHPNSIASLYLDLISLAETRGPIVHCKNCAKMILGKEFGQRRQFCSEECSNKLHARRNYARNKLKS